MGVTSKEIINQLLHEMGLPQSFLTDPTSATANVIRHFAVVLSYIFDLAPPSKSMRKKGLVEFILQQVPQCLQGLPQWQIPNEDGSLEKTYYNLARHFGVKHVINNQLEPAQIKQSSPFYSNYKHIGLFTLVHPIQHVEIQLTPEDQLILRDHVDAVVVLYIIRVNRATITQITPIRQSFNGQASTDLIQPFSYKMPAHPANLSLIEVSNPENVYALFYIAKQLSNADIFSILLKRPLLTSQKFHNIIKDDQSFMKQFTIQAVASADNDDNNEESDVQQITETVKLISSITLKKITMPVRGSSCRHFCDFMDLQELITNVKNGGTWECNVCSSECNYTQLFVDAFGWFLIQKGFSGIVEIKESQIVGHGGQDNISGSANSEQSGWDL